MTDSLELVLLANAMLVVVLARSLHLPPVLGYLLVGVVFLMFSIGLEFSSDPQLY
jgi:Kef-type K+ transport system membrane component KefB